MIVNVVRAGLVGVVLGVLTAYAQGWLPAEVGSLANSSGSWLLVAFVLALFAPRPGPAAVTGAVALLALLVGYVLGAAVRGFASSTALVAFWSAAAVVAGPLTGLAAYWVRWASAVWAAIGAGAVAGVLVGEGAYGLTVIADTTYPPYWWGEVVAGVLLLAVVAARRRFGPPALLAGVLTATAVAWLFVVVYQADLIGLL